MVKIFLVCWDRKSHFGDSNKTLISCVKKLLYFYTKHSLIKQDNDNNDNNSDYHTKPLNPDDIKCGNVYLLTLLKTFGFGWNPISVYYCYNETNTNLICLLFEMINVPWSTRHIYVLPINDKFAKYNNQEKQWIIEFMKICPFSPMDFTHFQGKPNGYCCTINNPLNSKENNGILQIHGHVFSFINNNDDNDIDDNNKNRKEKIIYKHNWGNKSFTSSCIIPKQSNYNNLRIMSRSPVIEFGINKCIESELNSYNLLYLFVVYPFCALVIRFQLYLFIIINTIKNYKINNEQNKKYSNKPYHSMHKRPLSYFELIQEFFTIIIGSIFFGFKTIWEVIAQCRDTLNSNN